MAVEPLRSLSLQAVALVALIAHPAFSAEDLELPAGEVMGGHGRLYRGRRHWCAVAGAFVEKSRRRNFRRQLLQNRTEIEVLPDFAVNHVEVLEGGRLFLVGGQADTGSGYVLRVVEVGEDEVEILWDYDGLPADLRNGEATLRIAKDGSRWGVMKRRARERELEFFFGDIDSYEVERAATVAILEEHYDEGALSTSYPDFTFLDSSSENLLLAVSFSGETFVLRIVGSSARSEYLQHGKGIDPRTLRWQPSDRILWVNWGSEWSGYDLWDLGLSAESPIPATLRKKVSRGYGKLLEGPHRQGGFVSVIENDGVSTVRLSGEGLEPRSGTLEGRLSRVVVSPNGYYAIAILMDETSILPPEVPVAKVLSLY